MTSPYDDLYPVFHCPMCAEPVHEEAEACPLCAWPGKVTRQPVK